VTDDWRTRRASRLRRREGEEILRTILLEGVEAEDTEARRVQARPIIARLRAHLRVLLDVSRRLHATEIDWMAVAAGEDVEP
jgi:hypothetical protein